MKYIVYRDSDGQYRWLLRAADDSLLADSGDGYRDLNACLSAITLVKGSRATPVQQLGWRQAG